MGNNQLQASERTHMTAQEHKNRERKARIKEANKIITSLYSYNKQSFRDFVMAFHKDPDSWLIKDNKETSVKT